MENELTNRASDLLDCGVCDVCGKAANTVTRDCIVESPIYSDGYPRLGPAYTVRRFCEEHRHGKVRFIYVSQKSYFARLKATEGDDL